MKLTISFLYILSASVFSYAIPSKEVEKSDNQLNKSITVLKKAIDVNPNCIRAYLMLFKYNISTNAELSLDYLIKLVEIDSSFLIILSNDIIFNMCSILEAFKTLFERAGPVSINTQL